MKNRTAIESIRQKYLALSPVMDQRMRRRWAAAEATALGRGGVTTVSTATGLARTPSRSVVANGGIAKLIRARPAAAGFARRAAAASQ